MSGSCIFHISANRYSANNTEHHTFKIWQELAKGFDEYHVLARNDRNRYAHKVYGKIHLHLLPSFGSGAAIFLLLSWVLPYFVWRYKPTHLLSQSPVMGGLAAAFCSRVFNVPLFVEFHGSSYFQVSRPGVKGLIEYFANRSLAPVSLRLSKRIRSLSDEMTSKILDTYGAGLGQKIITIPVRVDLEAFCSVKDSYDVGDPLKIIMVGSLCANKNQEKLIHDLASSDLKVYLTLAGDGPLRNYLESLAESLSPRISVNFTGNMSHRDLSQLLASQDIYVHYSHFEGTPRAVLEAMAVGVPVITADYPYMRGMVCDGVDALVIRKPAKDELIEAIKRLVGSRGLRESLGEGGKNLVQSRFDSRKVYELYRQSILGM